MDGEQSPKDEPFAHDSRAESKVVWGGAAAILLALGAVFFLTHEREEASGEKSVSAPTVTVAAVTPKPFARQITVSGEARPRVDVRVFAPIAGVRIAELLVDEGAMVREGQPLARLDTRVATAQIRAAEASVAEARAAETRALDEYRRAESIRESGALSAEAIGARKASADAASARARAAQAQLAETSARLEGGFVRAPNAGLVIERAAQVGQLVDGQALFRIAAGNALEVGVEVGEADMLAMKPGQEALFTMVDGSDVRARLRRVPASIDSRTRTGEAVFDLPTHASLRAGMFLRGQAELPPQERLAAPQAAIVFQDRQAAVFVLDASNRVKRTPVTLGARTGELVAIEAGLAPGARIVAGGAAFLQDGDPVTPVEPVPTAPQSGLRGRDGG